MGVIQGLKLIRSSPVLLYAVIMSNLLMILGTLWAILQPVPLTTISDNPLVGLWISAIMSFPNFLLAITILCVIPKGRVWLTDNVLVKLLGVNLLFLAVSLVGQAFTILPGIAIGVAATFLDGLASAFFMILLFWTGIYRISEKLSVRFSRLGAVLFFLAAGLGIIVFGAAWMMGGLQTLPFEYAIISMVFPTAFLLLPIMGLLYGRKTKIWVLTGVFGLLVLGAAAYYTFKLLGVAEVALDYADLPLQIVLLTYSLGSVLGKLRLESGSLQSTGLPLALVLCWAKATNTIQRVVVGSAVQFGSYSAIILTLALLALIIPVILLRTNSRGPSAAHPAP